MIIKVDERSSELLRNYAIFESSHVAGMWRLEEKDWEDFKKSVQFFKKLRTDWENIA